MQRTKSQLIRNALFLLISIGIFGFIGNIAKADTTHYLRPYQAYRMTTYDGNAEKSFTMMGVKYIHGLKTENYYNTSYADFNLGGQMNTVSFVVGHIDGDSDGEGTMKLYLDGEIQEAYTRALQNNMVNQTVTLNVTGKKQLVIVIEGNHAKYGIGNITETGAHNYDCTISKVATVHEDGLLSYTCKDCGDTYTEVDPAKTFCTDYITPYQSSHMDILNESFGAASYKTVMGNKYYQALSTSNYYNTSEALYNLSSAYTNVFFRVGHLDQDNEDTGTLNIYLDGTLVRTIDLSVSMLDTDVDLNTSSVTQLKIEITGNHARYVIFDIKATPLSKGTKEHSFVEETLVEAAFGIQGTVRHVCSVCGAYYTTSSPALTRNMTDEAIRINLDNDTYVYDGKAKKPKVTITYDGTQLVQNKDYTLSYSNNTKPGTAKVTVSGKGGYKSSISATFTIIPKKAALSSLKSKKKKQLTITWKKDSTVTGYEVEYSTSSSFWSYSTTTKIVKNKTSLTIKNLNSKTYYYVRIRGYKTINGEKTYGEYSATKSKKVK